VPVIRRLPPPARRLQFVEGSHNKFYDLLLHQPASGGWAYTAHYGRIGTVGSFQTKQFTHRYQAIDAYNKQLASKLRKGYVDVTGVPIDVGQVYAPEYADAPVRSGTSAPKPARAVAKRRAADAPRQSGKRRTIQRD
jgi:predicted DNA-binding WGR domain protein